MLQSKSRLFGMILGSLVALLAATTVIAQPTDADKMRTRKDRQIGSLIRSIDDIVWSNIRIYKLESDFKNRLVSSMQSEDEADLERLKQIGDILAPDPIPSFDQMALSIAASPAVVNAQVFRQQVGQRTGHDPEFDVDEAEADRAFSIAKSVIQNRKSRPKEFYLIASRDSENPRMIGLLGIDLETGRPAMTSFVKIGSNMYDYLSSNNTDSTMYGEMKQAVREGNNQLLSNQMFVLRDLANTAIVDRTNTRATKIDEGQHSFVLESVSMGRPIREEWKPADTASGDDGGGGGWDFDFDTDWGATEAGTDIVKGAAVPGAIEHPNEIVVGSDVLFGYYHYDMEDKQVKGADWGIEVLSNFDQINYPSIWGGRTSVNAILRNVKIGAILPTPRFGGETVAESGLFDKPQKILGGYGMAFSGDFTAPMLNNSGLFNFYASYTFGEASTENVAVTVYPNAGDTSLGFPSVRGEEVYLMRYAVQGYYSFGFYADNSAKHLFRMKLGGGVYGVDKFERQQVFRQDVSSDTVPTLSEFESESHGGVSGKIEYMKGGTDIPYGLGVQYFDGSLLGNVWLQFIVARNLDLKIQGKYFTPLMRDAHPWESTSLVVPSVELKYHFGKP